MNLLGKLRNAKGFTLTELLVIVALMIMMTGLGYSGFSSLMRKERVRAAAFQLAGDLREARMQAVEKHASHGFVVTGNCYTICTQPSSPNASCADASDIKVQDVDMYQQYSSVSVEQIKINGVAADPATLNMRFNAKGIPLDNAGSPLPGPVLIVLKATDGKQCTVDISTLGRIKVDES